MLTQGQISLDDEIYIIRNDFWLFSALFSCKAGVFESVIELLHKRIIISNQSSEQELRTFTKALQRFQNIQPVFWTRIENVYKGFTKV